MMLSFSAARGTFAFSYGPFKARRSFSMKPVCLQASCRTRFVAASVYQATLQRRMSSLRAPALLRRSICACVSSIDHRRGQAAPLMAAELRIGMICASSARF